MPQTIRPKKQAAEPRRMFDSVNTALQGALDEAGIETPFNTYDINILHMPGTAEDSNLNVGNTESQDQ